MAEAVLNIVLGKLADVIANEAQLLGGVEKKVEWVQRELTRIKCCLQDADSKSKGDARVQNWLNELRDVAYRIEDATDTFFLKVECRDASFLQKLKVCNKPKELYFRHKLGNELDDIQNLLKEIYESRVRLGISDLPLKDNSKGEADVIMPHRRATYQEVDETEVVGMQADKNNIMKLLHPNQIPRRAVITIVGAGGLGKTTLAHMVYKSAKEDFDYHIMLSISQQFSLTDLLRKMISKYNDSVPKDRNVDYYVGELKKFLSSRRYLIILDDVWEDDLWNELKYVLPDNKKGSRVLITSRSIEVEKSAKYETISYELKILDDGKSLDLLLKKALPYQEPDKGYPTDLLEVAGKLSKKCKGLPLALVVLGGILSKEPSYPTWDRMLQNMNWHVDGKDCMPILAMSYEDMPYYLKACFQYLASFPEDYVISARSLIRMLEAEGFIPLEGRRTIEIMAEHCLEELATRSMVQVLSRHVNGLIKYFKVHDILRDLAMDKAGHENFVTIFSHASNDTKPNRIIRRASLQAEEKNSQFMKYVGPNTRSLLLFEPKNSEMSLQCSNFRLLKVLVIVGDYQGREHDLKSLDKLIHLKYLELRDCEIHLSSFSFHRMKRLETLDVRGSYLCRESGDFWTIGTLMHVLINYEQYLNPPISIATLSNLRTLKWVTVKGAFDWKLPNLRKLSINNESKEWVSITNLLQTLPFLVSLGISVQDGHTLPMEIVYPKALPNYQNLQSLYLDGKWPENVNVEASLFPAHLVKLTLDFSHLNHNPMPELGKLNSLKKLHLGGFLLTEEKGPIICPEGFPALQYLRVDKYSQIEDLTVAQGVMPKLTYLRVFEDTKVHLPPELQHVTVERRG